mgnify:CR=1 FL=1
MCEYNKKHPNAPLMPYAIIETLDSEHKLPYVKDPIGNGIIVNVKFVNPYLDYLYESGKLINENEQTEEVRNAPYLNYCPSYKSEHCFLNVQGTSS